MRAVVSDGKANHPRQAGLSPTEGAHCLLRLLPQRLVLSHASTGEAGPGLQWVRLQCPH